MTHPARSLLVVVGLFATTLAVSAAPAAAAAAVGLVVTVGPSTGLLDGQPVAVTVDGLTPGQRYQVTRCAGPDYDTQCSGVYLASSGGDVFGGEPDDSTEGVADGAGTLQVALRLDRAYQVWRDIRGFDPIVGEPGTEVDCAVDACTIAVYPASSVPGTGGRLAETPITMAAEGTFTWPPASLALSTTSVRERSVVEADVAGMSRWSGYVSRSGVLYPLVRRQMCAGGPAPEADDCEPLTQDLGEAIVLGATGAAVSASASGVGVPVDRHFTTPNGPVDCAVVGCTFALTQPDGATTRRIPLTFQPEWAPWSSVSHFLSQAVAPVRGRRLTNPERADLAGRLQSRSTEGVDALITAARAGAADATSSTWVIGEVARTYQAFYGRGPDSAGLAYWVGRLRAGASPNEMARLFGGTREFRLTYGSSSDAGVVEAAYRNTLGRAPDAAGAAYWRQQLARGLSRAGLIHRFGRSAEFQARESPRVALAIIALTLIGRGTESEWRHMAPSPDVRITLHEAVADILASELVP